MPSDQDRCFPARRSRHLPLYSSPRHHSHLRYHSFRQRHPFRRSHPFRHSHPYRRFPPFRHLRPPDRPPLRGRRAAFRQWTAPAAAAPCRAATAAALPHRNLPRSCSCDPRPTRSLRSCGCSRTHLPRHLPEKSHNPACSEEVLRGDPSPTTLGDPLPDLRGDLIPSLQGGLVPSLLADL
ncbi:unnamed protein product [Closterium sp. NIES-53]